MSEKYFRQPPTTPQHFTAAPSAQIERSTFDRSFGHKTTIDHGYIYPVMVDEVLPGDTFDVKSTAFIRLATPLKPIMDNVYVDIHYFFVPNRLVWDNWEKFMGQTTGPNDVGGPYAVPHTSILLSAVPNNNFPFHYMGVPHVPDDTGTDVVSFNALPLRGYAKIWNEWYRDENLQDEIPVTTGDDATADWFTPLSIRNKRADYFTTCLPWPQKGSAVTIDLGDSADIKMYQAGDATGKQFQLAATGNLTDDPRTISMYDNGGSATLGYGGSVVTDTDGVFIANHNLYTDLTTAVGITINDLRIAFQVQKLLERDARGGTRYVELILSHFGVSSDDHRLQRSEFLGAGTAALNVNPVASTFTDGTTAIGDLGATATVVQTGGFKKSFTEHGFVFAMLSTRADLNYQQGLERFWMRKTRYDYYFPAFAHLGEQSVVVGEIYTTGDLAQNREIFGYQERWAEYRYKKSIISGLFNSNMPASLDVWHLAQDFASKPALNGSFLAESGVPIDRVIAVPSEPHYLVDLYFKMKCTRPMPTYSVPGLIDHF